MRPSAAFQRPIGALWTLLSMLVGVVALFCLAQPDWITVFTTERDQHSSYGLLSYCSHYLFEGHEHHFCRPYADSVAGRRRLLDAPSIAWSVALGLYGMGSCTLFIAGLAAIPTAFASAKVHRRIVRPVGRAQLFAMTLMILAMLLVPCDLTGKQLDCGPAAYYSFGQCEVGWAYALAAMTTLLSIFCPILAQFTTFYPADADGESAYDSEYRLLNERSSTDIVKEFFV
uniref:Transmembrane protein 211 n=1 Tax=Plectus sambesii TaxID=2011161 RepID=A0A914W2N3_9BILA